jgi:O-antigen ligase
MIRRPFLGVGIGCYPLARKAWYGWGLWAHNHYGQLFGELGVTGTVVWFLLIYWTFRNLLEVKRIVQEKAPERNYFYYLSNAVIGCLFIRLVVGYTVHSLYGFIWYICAALSVVSLDIVRRETLSKEDGRIG